MTPAAATPHSGVPASERPPGPGPVGVSPGGGAARPVTHASAGPRTIFSVPFRSEMGVAQSERLVRALQMTSCMHPKLYSSPARAGLLRLAQDSGLLLLAGDNEGEWRLEGRTWGEPQPELVHQWHVLAAQAARELDPGVRIPERTPRPPLEPTFQVGRAANKPLARFVRRHLGLP